MVPGTCRGLALLRTSKHQAKMMMSIGARSLGVAFSTSATGERQARGPHAQCTVSYNVARGQVRRNGIGDLHRDVNHTHEMWSRHTSPLRHVRHWALFPFSATLQRLMLPDLAVVASVSVALTYANSVAGQAFSIPIMREFTLTTSVLGLLLVFRTNSSNARFNDARACWGQVINSSRTLLRNAGIHVQPKSHRRYEKLVSLVRAYPRVLAFHVCKGGDLDATTADEGNTAGMAPEEVLRHHLTEIITDDDVVDEIMGAAHRPMVLLNRLSREVEKVELEPLLSQRLDAEVRTLENALGGMERLLLTPIPTMYTRHSSRFLSCWGFFLPFALFPVCGLWTAPASLLVAYALFAIEDIGVTLEAPFTVLPNWNYVEAIDKSANVSLQTYDNSISHEPASALCHSLGTAPASQASGEEAVVLRVSQPHNLQ